MSFEAPRPRKPFPNSSRAEADLFRGELSTCKDAHQASAAGQVPPLRKYGLPIQIAMLQSRPGTEISNPAPSSGESRANSEAGLVWRRQAEPAATTGGDNKRLP